MKRWKIPFLQLWGDLTSLDLLFHVCTRNTMSIHKCYSHSMHKIWEQMTHQSFPINTIIGHSLSPWLVMLVILPWSTGNRWNHLFWLRVGFRFAHCMRPHTSVCRLVVKVLWVIMVYGYIHLGHW